MPNKKGLATEGNRNPIEPESIVAKLIKENFSVSNRCVAKGVIWWTTPSSHFSRFDSKLRIYGDKKKIKISFLSSYSKILATQRLLKYMPSLIAASFSLNAGNLKKLTFHTASNPAHPNSTKMLNVMCEQHLNRSVNKS